MLISNYNLVYVTSLFNIYYFIILCSAKWNHVLTASLDIKNGTKSMLHIINYENIFLAYSAFMYIEHPFKNAFYFIMKYKLIC